MPKKQSGPEPLQQKAQYHRYFIYPHPECLTAIAEFLQIQATAFLVVEDVKGDEHEVWQLGLDELQNLSAMRKEAGYRYAIWKVESGSLIGKLYASHLREIRTEEEKEEVCESEE